MIRKTIILFAVLTLVISILPACNGDGDDGIAPGMRAAGTIQGRVFDLATGDPIGDVDVMIISTPFATDTTGTNEVTVFTTTNANGDFVRGDISNGFIEVHVRRDGYRTPAFQTWSLSPGGAGTFRFDMAPGEDPIPEFEGDEQSAWPPNYQH